MTFFPPNHNERNRLRAVVPKLHKRIRELEAELAGLREQIAQEIEAEMKPYDLDSPALTYRVVRESALELAARVARGAAQPEETPNA
jgi:hypothetical protein